jgi:putative selenate reductase FAD-binding subunit
MPVYTIRELAFPGTAEEALSLLRKGRNNVILGGGCWLALGRRRYGVGIDLSRLGLDAIRREGDELVLGGSATLRALEKNEDACALFGGILSHCVRPIVGVQLRSRATVGGSVYARFGFSDPLTALLCLDCTVELAGEGTVPLEVFAARPAVERDIVTGVRIRIEDRATAMETMRLTATDLPILTAAVSRLGKDWRVVVGARPGRPVRVPGVEAALAHGASPAQAGRLAAEGLTFGSDLRAGREYRALLAETLVARCAARVEQEVSR